MAEHTAELAKLQLTDEKSTLYAGQLSDILDYAEMLQALDADAILLTASVLPSISVLREDKSQSSLPREMALTNAADAADG